MRFIKKLKSSFYITLSILFIVIACKVEPPNQTVIDKAKTRVDQIVDSLRTNQNVVISAEIAQEYFDDQKNQYIIDYDIETGLDSTSIVDSEGSMYLEPKNNEWHYNFVFNDSYRGIIK